LSVFACCLWNCRQIDDCSRIEIPRLLLMSAALAFNVPGTSILHYIVKEY
jgi:hypothetical protein